MERNIAFEKGMLFHTYEMMDWLREKEGAPYQMSEALLGAWVGVIRGEALSRAAYDEKFFFAVQDGQGFLILESNLAPSGWHDEDLLSKISSETGLLYREIRPLLHIVGEKLQEIASKKAFEPIGWFAQESGGNFRVQCWPDFLQPRIDGPKELLSGLDLSTENPR